MTFEVQKLNESGIRELCEKRFIEKIKDQQHIWGCGEIEDLWKNMTTAVNKTAEEIVGKKRNTKRPLFNLIYEEVIKRK